MATTDTPMHADVGARLAGFPSPSRRRRISWSESIVSGLVGAVDALALILVGLAFYTMFLG